MKMLAALLVLTALVGIGCAHAVPVTWVWTNPTFNALSQGSCAASADTCKDLSIARVYVQEQGRTDSLLFATKGIAGQTAKADSVSGDLQTDKVWLAWIYVWDTIGNRSCKSNVAIKDLSVPPTAGTMK